MKTALIACEQSGAVRSRLRSMAIEAWSCDILPAEDGSEFHIQGDAIEALNSRQWDMVIAFPPCTHLAVSGSRWFPEKRADGRQQEAIKFFMEFANCSAPLVAIENPVCIMSTEWRKPNQVIQPWQFGHGETKKTCLWLKGLPPLEHTNVVEGREQRVWKMGPGPERAKERSRTYAGIADAIASQWGKILGQ